ncbi:MAG: Com family DNA-binding transcriptional regulator [Deltaproteobacteria bacterium]|nr:Com family DNA-binding transcriptional regulator [Deltaproteobacteria bacterium]
MTEFRCKKCGRLFFRADVSDAHIEIKCPKCGYTQHIIKSAKKDLIFSEGKI